MLSFSTSRYLSSTFGGYIRKARLEKGLRQVDVAKAIGVDEMTIVNWESYASVPMRGHANIRRLCQILSVAYQEVLTRFLHGETLVLGGRIK